MTKTLVLNKLFSTNLITYGKKFTNHFYHHNHYYNGQRTISIDYNCKKI